MEIPMRPARTDWGTFYATAPDGATVLFRTRSSNQDNPEQFLTINRLRYSSEVELRRDEPRRSARHYVDSVWHVDLSDVSYRLRRYPGGGAATMNSQSAVREHILPALVTWLRGADGLALLAEGSSYKLATHREKADLARQVLDHAASRVARIDPALAVGHGVDTADQTFLQFLTTDAEAAVRRGEPPIGGVHPAQLPTSGRQVWQAELPGL